MGWVNMGRMYSATFEEVAVTAQQDLLKISSIDGVGGVADLCLIHSISLSQSSDAGDAQAEMLNIIGFLTTGINLSAGTVVTPTPMQVGDAAYKGKVLFGTTTKTSRLSGFHIHLSESFNVCEGFYKQFAPNERSNFSVSSGFVLSLDTTPADSLTMSSTIVFEAY